MSKAMTRRPRCRATRRDGNPCTAPALAGGEVCREHDAGARIAPGVLPYLFRAARPRAGETLATAAPSCGRNPKSRAG